MSRCVLDHQQFPAAAFTAVEGDVLVASVRVKTADAFLVREER